MRSNVEVPTNENTPLTLSLEFAWKAKSTYWAGEIRVIDVYIDGQVRYTIDIPQRNDRETQAISLPFKKRNPGPMAPTIDYLIIKNLDTTQKITLKAGIFNKVEGDTLSQTRYGSWERNFRYTREDVSLDVDFSSLTLGNHYKITATHSMKTTEPGSPFWQGESLHTIVEADGPSKKNAPKAPSTLFNALLPSEQEFRRRRERSNNQQEIAFFTLALEKKYEEAIMYASNMDDQGLGGRLILDLLKYRNELRIDVNTMNNNPLRQTPLHRVTINNKWHAYYALASGGADSMLVDINGSSANNYRSAKGMDIYTAPEELKQIFRDLLGDDAAAAEAVVDLKYELAQAVSTLIEDNNSNCRIC